MNQTAALGNLGCPVIVCHDCAGRWQCLCRKKVLDRHKIASVLFTCTNIIADDSRSVIPCSDTDYTGFWAIRFYLRKKMSDIIPESGLLFIIVHVISELDDDQIKVFLKEISLSRVPPSGCIQIRTSFEGRSRQFSKFCSWIFLKNLIFFLNYIFDFEAFVYYI